MPIKLNGTTILDESTLANKDLSNISSAGNNVINNIATTAANQAIASANMIKAPNFSSAVVLSAQQQYDGYTPNKDGVYPSYCILQIRMVICSFE